MGGECCNIRTAELSLQTYGNFERHQMTTIQVVDSTRCAFVKAAGVLKSLVLVLTDLDNRMCQRVYYCHVRSFVKFNATTDYCFVYY